MENTNNAPLNEEKEKKVKENGKPQLNLKILLVMIVLALIAALTALLNPGLPYVLQAIAGLGSVIAVASIAYSSAALRLYTAIILLSKTDKEDNYFPDKLIKKSLALTISVLLTVTVLYYIGFAQYICMLILAEYMTAFTVAYMYIHTKIQKELYESLQETLDNTLENTKTKQLDKLPSNSWKQLLKTIVLFEIPVQVAWVVLTRAIDSMIIQIASTAGITLATLIIYDVEINETINNLKNILFNNDLTTVASEPQHMNLKLASITASPHPSPSSGGGESSLQPISLDKTNEATISGANIPQTVKVESALHQSSEKTGQEEKEKKKPETTVEKRKKQKRRRKKVVKAQKEVQKLNEATSELAKLMLELNKELKTLAALTKKAKERRERLKV